MDFVGHVVLVDDEKIVRLSYKNELERRGYEVYAYGSPFEALEKLTPDWPGIIVTDLVMPGMTGLELMLKVKELDPDLPVVLVTGQGDVPLAVKAIRDGAYDFLEKPFETELFLDVVRRAQEKRKLILEVRRLQQRVAGGNDSAPAILGESPVMERLRQLVKNVADTPADVLIRGETGTGKDLVATCLHDQSKRRDENYVAINCGALPETLIESELFGHEPGSFTGADRRRIGKFEYAAKGTIFLDEIESMPLHLQVKLLRVLQERTIERVGSNTPIPIDVRVIAATKTDLKEASANGKFRQDLYYRLNVVEIQLPPLRERKQDIPLMFQRFILDYCARFDLKVSPPSQKCLDELMKRNWEGNVRELKNEAEKFVLGLNVQVPECREVEPVSAGEDPEPGESDLSFKARVAAFERSLIERELARQGGNIKKVQDALSIPKQTLYDKIKNYGIDHKSF